MSYTIESLARALRTQMYHVLMGGDASVKPPADAFLTWCMPGLPFEEGDFDFAAGGLSGRTAEESKQRYQQAFTFAMAVDYLPDPQQPLDGEEQQAIWENRDGSRMSVMYDEILKQSKVIKQSLTDAEQEELKRLRGMLTVTVTQKDLLGREKEVTEDSPAVRAYNEAKQRYEHAVLTYNAKRIAAQAATGEKGNVAVQDWELNGAIYRQDVDDAWASWGATGYREDIQEIRDRIEQITQRSMIHWKGDLQNAYRHAILSSPEGIEFPYTTVVPAGFATSDGWTGYSLYHEMTDTDKVKESDSWDAGGQFDSGLWSVSGGHHSSSTEFHKDHHLDSFDLSFEMTQVQIVRPWFSPEFLTNRGWDLPAGAGWRWGEPPSDGERPPQGKLVGYGLQMLLVRNLVIESEDLAKALDTFSKEVGGADSFGIGPLTLGGSYGSSSSGRKYRYEHDGATIKVPGMQVIAFRNHLFGKTPDLLPGIKEDQLG
ncbi:unnamed protein product [[Actinomadura] parvosata subsp. kistnae]|uniref:Uncharacterized protein n=1 Tax=[Actinomadura] parvosata subsp. kistnae TaxID=1909395 RepID=A0A1U9ZY52_9ACTN|nr:hypothetical protein [Nonomuraea sp. ATCC 55076]AQZ62839.1 hypothetical protein BKM31_16485 [Nonomuraea sp. ATCC 55076]SPL98380.1 unnamed protein product [Actinomadura parvosata subsp. kistnae]